MRSGCHFPLECHEGRDQDGPGRAAVHSEPAVNLGLREKGWVGPQGCGGFYCLAEGEDPALGCWP